MKQVSQMVQKIRKDGKGVEKVLWEGEDESTEYKQKIQDMGCGMVLSGSVVDVGACRNCQEYEVEI
jgi:hypothetical protein